MDENEERAADPNRPADALLPRTALALQGESEQFDISKLLPAEEIDRLDEEEAELTADLEAEEEQSAFAEGVAAHGRNLAYETLIAMNGTDLRKLAESKGIDWANQRYQDIAEAILAHDEGVSDRADSGAVPEDVDYHAVDPAGPTDERWNKRTKKLTLTRDELVLCATALSSHTGHAEDASHVVHRVNEEAVRFQRAWGGQDYGFHSYLVTLPNEVNVAALAQ